MNSEPKQEYSKITRESLQAIKRLLLLASPYRILLTVAGLLMLISTGISLSLPLAAKWSLDRVIKTHEVHSLDQLAIIMIALVIFGSFIGYAQYLMVAWAGNKIVMEIRQKLFGHIQRLPISFFDITRSGDLTSHLSNDVSLLQQTLTDDLVHLAGNVITLFGGIALALVIDWKLTAVVVALLMATMSFFVIFGKRLRKMTRSSLDALSDVMGMMTESISNIRLVKAFAREPYEDNRATEKLSKVFHLNMRASKLEGVFGLVAFAGFILVLVGVVWYGGRGVLTGSLTAGSLLAFLMTVTIISGPMSSLAMQYARLQRAVGAADRLFAILDDPLEQADPPDAVDFPAGDSYVEYSNVDFFYNPETPVLRGFSLPIPAGKITALVGPSGSGKTTVASLLYRFYEIQSGCIRIDGVSLNSMRRQDLRENIGLVPQEPILFNGTIHENIRYGRLEATDSEIEAAAVAANVAEFVELMPEGYGTVIGEKGMTLSGGQRQRVAIARAILKDPRILVLDEATSALDTQSEMLVQEALERLMTGRTTIVIAHRLSTIRNAHQIAVLDAGSIVEIGTHDELIAMGGRYSTLNNIGDNQLT